jgi:hypothetical protein
MSTEIACMERNELADRLSPIGRAAAWVVLLILLASVVYAGFIAIVNWGPIGV